MATLSCSIALWWRAATLSQRAATLSQRALLMLPRLLHHLAAAMTALRLWRRTTSGHHRP